MEFSGPLKFLGFFLFAQTACNVAERSIGALWLRICVTGHSRTVRGVLRLLCVGRRRRLLILPHFQLGAIFRRKDVLALQIFSRVNVLGFFLLAMLPGLILAGGFGNTLVLL
jgi:hypothetical protein